MQADPMFLLILTRYGPSPEPLNYVGRSAVDLLLQTQGGAK